MSRADVVTDADVEEDEKFASLVRRLEDRSLLSNADDAAAAASAARTALQARLARPNIACASQQEQNDARDHIACIFLSASPQLNLLNVFDAHARETGGASSASAGSVCVPILVIVSRLLSCLRVPSSSSSSSSTAATDTDNAITSFSSTTMSADTRGVHAAKLDALALAMIQTGRLRMYYAFLSSGMRARSNAVLLLLASVVRRGGRFAREVLNRFDWKLNVLGRLARPRLDADRRPHQKKRRKHDGDDESDKDDDDDDEEEEEEHDAEGNGEMDNGGADGTAGRGKVRKKKRGRQQATRRNSSKVSKPTRYALQELAIALLRCRDDSVVRTVVAQDAPLKILLRQIGDDEDTEQAFRLLEVVAQVVVESDTIPTRLRSALFGEAVLYQLANMCEYLDVSKLELRAHSITRTQAMRTMRELTSASISLSVAEKLAIGAHTILCNVCCMEERRRGRVHQKRRRKSGRLGVDGDAAGAQTKKLSKFILGLRSFTSASHELLLLRVADDNPLLALDLLGKMSFAFEPTCSARWIKSIALFSRMATIVHEYCVHVKPLPRRGFRSEAQALDVHLRNLLRTLSRALFSRGLLHKSAFVRYHTAQLIHVLVVDIVLPILDVIGVRDDGWTKVRESTRSSTGGFEDLNAAEEVDEDDDEDDESDNEDAERGIGLSDVMATLPDVQTLVAVLSHACKDLYGIHQRRSKDQEQEGEEEALGTEWNNMGGSEVAASSTLIGLRMLRLLTLYYDSFPAYMARNANTFDPANLITMMISPSGRMCLPPTLVRGLLQLQKAFDAYLLCTSQQHATATPSVTLLASLVAMAMCQSQCGDSTLSSSEFPLRSEAMNACSRALGRCDTFAAEDRHMGARETSWVWMTALTAFEYATPGAELDAHTKSETNCVARFFAEAVVSSAKSITADRKAFESALHATSTEQSRDNAHIYDEMCIHFVIHIVSRCFKVAASKSMRIQDKASIVAFVCCGMKLALMTLSGTESRAASIASSIQKLITAEDVNHLQDGGKSNGMARGIRTSTTNGDGETFDFRHAAASCISRMLKTFANERPRTQAAQDMKPPQRQSDPSTEHDDVDFQSIGMYVPQATVAYMFRDVDASDKKARLLSGLEPSPISDTGMTAGPAERQVLLLLDCIVTHGSTTKTSDVVNALERGIHRLDPSMCAPFARILLHILSSTTSRSHDVSRASDLLQIMILQALTATIETAVRHGDASMLDRILHVTIRDKGVVDAAYTYADKDRVKAGASSEIGGDSFGSACAAFMTMLLKLSFERIERHSNNIVHVIQSMTERATSYLVDSLHALAADGAHERALSRRINAVIPLVAHLRPSQCMRLILALAKSASEHVVKNDEGGMSQPSVQMSHTWRHTACVILEAVFVGSRTGDLRNGVVHTQQHITTEDESELWALSSNSEFYTSLSSVMTSLLDLYDYEMRVRPARDESTSHLALEMERISGMLLRTISRPRIGAGTKTSSASVSDDASTPRAMFRKIVDPMVLTSSPSWSGFVTRSIMRTSTQQRTSRDAVTNLELVAKLVETSSVRWSECGSVLMTQILRYEKAGSASRREKASTLSNGAPGVFQDSFGSFQFHDLMRLLDVVDAYLHVASKLHDGASMVRPRNVESMRSSDGDRTDGHGAPFVLSLACLKCYTKYLGKKCSVNMHREQHTTIRRVLTHAVQILGSEYNVAVLSSTAHLVLKPLDEFVASSAVAAAPREGDGVFGEEGTAYRQEDYDLITANILAELCLSFDAILEKANMARSSRSILRTYTSIVGYLSRSFCRSSELTKRGRGADAHYYVGQLQSSLEHTCEILRRRASTLPVSSPSMSSTTKAQQNELVVVDQVEAMVTAAFKNHIQNAHMMSLLSALLAVFFRPTLSPSNGGALEHSSGHQALSMAASRLFDLLVSHSKLPKVVLRNLEQCEYLPVSIQRQSLPLSSTFDYAMLDADLHEENHEEEKGGKDESAGGARSALAAHEIVVSICKIMRSLLLAALVATTTTTMPVARSNGNVPDAMQRETPPSQPPRWIDGRSFQVLTQLLLCGYHATMSCTDQELLATILTIERVERSQKQMSRSSLVSLGRLWGRAAQFARRVSGGSRRNRYGGSGEGTSTDVSASMPRILAEQNVIDCRRVAMGVIHFPHRRAISPDAGDIHCDITTYPPVFEEFTPPTAASQYGYDPAFILPFTSHALHVGAISASDASSQGLLALAIMALCSEDEPMRTSGYMILSLYVDKSALQHFREKPALLALINALQSLTGESSRTRLPAFLCTFCAEASVTLHHPTLEIYPLVQKELMRSPLLNPSTIPLFNKLMGSGTLTHRRHRTWALKLLSTGARHAHAADESILRRGFVAELLMSACSSSIFDFFTRRHVLDAVTRVASIRFNSSDLEQHAGVVQWLVGIATAPTSTTVGSLSSSLSPSSSSSSLSLSSYAVDALVRLVGRLGGEAGVRAGMTAALHMCGTCDEGGGRQRTLLVGTCSILSAAASVASGNTSTDGPLNHRDADITLRDVWAKGRVRALSGVWTSRRYELEKLVTTTQESAGRFEEDMAIFETMTLLLPGSSLSAHPFSNANALSFVTAPNGANATNLDDVPGPGDFAFDTWCDAVEWCLLCVDRILNSSISKSLYSSSSAKRHEALRFATSLYRVIASIAAFSKTGTRLKLRMSIDAPVPGDEDIIASRLRRLAHSMSRAYDVLPLQMQRTCVEDMSYAYLALLSCSSSSPSTFSRIHHAGSAAHEYVRKALDLASSSPSSKHLLLVSLRLFWSNAPLPIDILCQL